MSESIWLCDVLDDIGANDGYRQMCYEHGITNEIINSLSGIITNYRVGSRIEGSVTPGVMSDLDGIICDEQYPVIEDITQSDKTRICLLIVREPETPAGYVKLQLVVSSVPCMLKHWPFLCCVGPAFKKYFKPDKFERVVLFDLIDITVRNFPFLSRFDNKPALTLKNVFDYINIDKVVCYQCNIWPTLANEWLSRLRYNGWPTTKTINELKSLGFFVVKKGHPFSQEINLEWRISFTLQERQLIFNLTDVQYKCYVILKMINRDVLGLDCITSYHWKTCLFYIIEENEASVWVRENLFRCVRLCIKQMLMWVKRGYCPNYFIPTENMFEGKMIKSLKAISKNKLVIESLRVDSENKLVKLLKQGFDCFLQVRSNNLCDFVRSRENVEGCAKLRIKSKDIYNNDIYMKKLDTCHCVMACVGLILEHHKDHNEITEFIKFLWATWYTLGHVDTISGHTPQDTRRTQSLLQPFIYTCLASNISAMCIQQPNTHVRDFLLYGCYTFFKKGGLSGRLKFISVLYAIGCYKECKLYLDKEDEEDIKYNPSVCVCHNIPSKHFPLDITEIEMSQLKMSTCVIFLPTELPITPDALKIDMFRDIGIAPHQINIKDFRWLWHTLAVVDSNLYYFFLKFLIHRKIEGTESLIYAMFDIKEALELMNRSKIRHHDVFYNLMSWCFRDMGYSFIALDMSRMSWNIPRPLDSMILFCTKEMRQIHYQFNSSKIHTLVILYNIWFKRIPLRCKFCFQCFNIIYWAIHTCNRCKAATYCSNPCKNKNKSVHKAVCEIVRRYSNIKETILCERN